MDVSSNLSPSRLQLSALATRLRPRAAWLLPALVVALGLALRLYRLGAQSLWLDEGATWAEVTGRTGKGWLALLAELFSKDAAYPLYHMLLKAWVVIAGDTEWALRFPSALAGAASVLAIYLAASELTQRPSGGKCAGKATLHPLSVLIRPLIASFLFATSPFALWYAQDAKVYSLLLLAVALELWALLRALRRADRRSWLLLIAFSIACLFVHRLALLVLAGVALACVVAWPSASSMAGDTRRSAANLRPALLGPRPLVLRISLGLLALALAVVGVAGTILAVRGESAGAGGHIPAGPLEALWLTGVRFSLDRWPGDIAGYGGLPLAAWLLPSAILTLWGLALLLRDALAGRVGAVAILGLLIVPLALLALALALMPVPVYEARYATVAFPAWVIVLAYPFGQPKIESRERARLLAGARLLALGSLLLVNALVLLQPQKGLFSGAAVKEQWRAGIAALAARAHPDDLIILHPYYVQPLWDYYAPRVAPNSLAAIQPVMFTNYSSGYFYKGSYAGLTAQQRADRIRRDQDRWYDDQAHGKKRALLLIAPAHSRLIDPVNSPEDSYGWLGLRFQYAERAWSCGKTRFVGVELLCLSYPEAYKTAGPAAMLDPAIQLDATFGGELRLRGYSLDPFGGAAHPGGTLPVTLYWQAARTPTRDYTMFLHLCRDCSSEPLAQDDSPPLGGDFSDPGRTTTWIVDDPVHDERSLVLPKNLAPGHYTLLLGVYPIGDPAEGARLTVTGTKAEVIGGTRLILGGVDIQP
jgi:hypothetical protein